MTEANDTQDTYMLDDNGKLFRKGEHIGDLNEKDEIKLLPDMKQFAAPVTRWLRARANAQEQQAPIDQSPAEVLPIKKKGADADEDELKSLTKESAAAAEKSRTSHQDDVGFSQKTGCPPPPKKNPQFGDKTPAYVDWLQRYRPAEWKARYGVKGMAKVPVVVTNPDTGIDEVTGYRDAHMASRKTHLTEKEETNRGLAEDMDWDA